MLDGEHEKDLSALRFMQMTLITFSVQDSKADTCVRTWSQCCQSLEGVARSQVPSGNKEYVNDWGQGCTAICYVSADLHLKCSKWRSRQRYAETTNRRIWKCITKKSRVTFSFPCSDYVEIYIILSDSSLITWFSSFIAKANKATFAVSRGPRLLF